MNRKFVYGIVAGVVASTTAIAVADEATEMTLEERVAALEAGNKGSSWAEMIRIKGDLRYRYEYKATDDDTTTDRHRIRARIGAYAKVNDNVDAGIRLATGDNEDPTSTNQTLDGDFEKKDVWVDLAYITLGCEQIEGLSATFGKMKQPWVSVSDLIFDTDVNPEGISSAYEFGSDTVSLTAIVAYHMLDDKGTGNDDNLTSGQIAAETDLSDSVKLTAGAGAYYYSELNYELVDGFVQADIDTDLLPIKVYGEYLNNTASGVSEDTAWIVGFGTTCPITGVKIGYNYRDIETDSVNPDLDDSDFGGAGKGHKISAKYGIAKNTTIGSTYFRTERGGSDYDVLQLDLVVKF